MTPQQAFRKTMSGEPTRQRFYKDFFGNEPFDKLVRPGRHQELNDDDIKKELDMPEPQTFTEAVADLRKRDKTLKSGAAMQLARRKYPQLFEKHQSEGEERSNAAFEKIHAPKFAKSDAVVAFEKIVDQVQERDGCSRLTALTKAARENPTELEAYRDAQS